jgi:hypothetical protein
MQWNSGTGAAFSFGTALVFPTRTKRLNLISPAPKLSSKHRPNTRKQAAQILSSLQSLENNCNRSEKLRKQAVEFQERKGEGSEESSRDAVA